MRRRRTPDRNRQPQEQDDDAGADSGTPTVGIPSSAPPAGTGSGAALRASHCDDSVGLPGSEARTASTH